MSEKEILKLIEKGVNMQLIADKAGISRRALNYRIERDPKYKKAHNKRLALFNGM